MASFSLLALRQIGFEGFCQIGTLRSDRCARVPTESGVYLILHKESDTPKFLEKGTGGRFKNREPNIPVATLESKWVRGSPVAYIGKAGGAKSRRTLQRRLFEYVQFGCGLAVPHWGGRMIWQLSGSDNLEVCWRTHTEADLFERELLARHAAEFGALPFANLRR